MATFAVCAILTPIVPTVALLTTPRDLVFLPPAGWIGLMRHGWDLAVQYRPPFVVKLAASCDRKDYGLLPLLCIELERLRPSQDAKTPHETHEQQTAA